MTAPKIARTPWLWPLVRKRKMAYGPLRRAAARMLVSREAYKRAGQNSARTRAVRFSLEVRQGWGRLGGQASVRGLTTAERRARGVKAAQTRIRHFGADVHVHLGRRAAAVRWGDRNP